jgi:hypothetical protein
MKREISFDNVISGRCFDGEWRDMTTEEREEALEKIKEVLLMSCRSNSQYARAIKRMSLTNLPAGIGIYNRLKTSEYVAGQSYPDEIKYIKEQIKRQC